MVKGKMAMSVEDHARQNCASLLRAREERKAAARATARALASAASRLSLGKRVYKCKICDEEFKTPQGLGRHKKRHPEIPLNGGDQEPVPRKEAKIYECKECHARFSFAIALIGHQKKHTKAGRKRKRGGCKTQTGAHQDKPLLPFNLNVKPLDLNLPPEDE